MGFKTAQYCICVLLDKLHESYHITKLYYMWVSILAYQWYKTLRHWIIIISRNTVLSDRLDINKSEVLLHLYPFWVANFRRQIVEEKIADRPLCQPRSNKWYHYSDNDKDWIWKRISSIRGPSIQYYRMKQYDHLSASDTWKLACSKHRYFPLVHCMANIWKCNWLLAEILV